jgi:hypothetical protein
MAATEQGGLSRILEALFYNPIMVKTLHATFRGKRFLVSLTVCIGLLALTMLTVAYFMSEGNPLRKPAPSDIGYGLFLAFVIVQYVVVFFVFPAFSCIAVTEEKIGKSFDLLVTTALKPWEIVWGKFKAAFLYCFLFLAATLPLALICFLFGGIAPADIFGAYLAMLVVASVITVFGLFVSSASNSTARAIIATYLAILIVFPLLSSIFGNMVAFLVFGMASGGRGPSLFGARGPLAQAGAAEIFFAVAIPIFLFVSVFSFFFLLATNRLKPSSANRSTSLRIYFVAFCTLASLLVAGLLFTVPAFPTNRGVIMSAAAVYYGVMGLVLLVGVVVFSGEPLFPSLRIRNRLARLRLLNPFRLVYPGSLSGFLFAIIVSSVVLYGMAGVFYEILLAAKRAGAKVSGTVPPPETIIISASCLLGFLFFVGSLTLLLGTLVKKTTVVKIAVFGLVAGLCLAPVFSFAFHSRREPSRLYQGYYLSPPLVFITVWDRSRGELRWRAILSNLTEASIRKATQAESRRLERDPTMARLPAKKRSEEIKRRTRVFESTMKRSGIPLYRFSFFFFMVLGTVLLAIALGRIYYLTPKKVRPRRVTPPMPQSGKSPPMPQSGKSPPSPQSGASP